MNRTELTRIEGRLAEVGWNGLGDLDLLILLLAPGRGSHGIEQAARRLEASLGGVSGLREASYTELRQAGLGHSRALGLLSARQIFRRVRLRLLPSTRSFRSSGEIFHYFRARMEGLKRECFWALLLDGKNRVFRILKVSEGTLTRSLVHPREVFRPAVREAAASLLFVHNHPSGSPEPSREDLQVTQRLVETGKLLGIRVLDHVIIGSYRYFSFADEGLLGDQRGVEG